MVLLALISSLNSKLYAYFILSLIWLDESLKPCVKILNLLKNSKSSWPFREPVDPIAMGIPHYNEIVK
jgi:hypothetical protein